MLKILAISFLALFNIQAFAANAECDFVTQQSPQKVLHIFSAAILDASAVRVGVQPDCQTSVTHFMATSFGAQADGVFKIGSSYTLVPREEVGTPYCAGSDLPASLLLDGSETKIGLSKSALNATLTFQSGKEVSGICYYF